MQPFPSFLIPTYMEFDKNILKKSMMKNTLYTWCIQWAQKHTDLPLNDGWARHFVEGNVAVEQQLQDRAQDGGGGGPQLDELE
jgi:hypothetical protein